MPIEFQISDRGTTPPNGWRWVQPESGQVFEHYSRDAFFEAIRNHRLANGYPISADWREEIEDGICRTHPEWGQTICRRIQSLGARRPISFGAMQSFLNVMGSWTTGIAKGEDAFVSPEEAQRRAAICAGCEFNVAYGFSCGGCMDRLMRALTFIGRRETEFDQHLGSCAICSCALKAAVWLPLEVQQSGLNEQLRAEFRAVPHCWKKQNL